MIDKSTLWIVIIGLGVGSFLLRFAFTGFVGDRQMPAGLLRHLRYTAVAVLPALVAPQVLWPAATGGEPDPARLAAAAAALAVGLLTKNVLAAMFAGGLTLYGMLYLLG
ncbi:AzlD domain-containing protein [Sulfitobacter geojensis]|jgi:branched-subunit amino acid transport protein|uniref:AzlD domain-containing protein n=1 Tax=Sulfitobacter geojensis TaxID=1342299 RepID=A0AAE2VZ98_9RHOB|nr:AzlD domain-containing protein [Sulfitobacter geojensis]KHA53522.1 putative branched-chain amino acid transport protein [Sulfitobacter geojensis]MBM1690263.1 AzlD domain-containing protein [Sulfitobacter geojensis]MBM1694329.1 AzlD domain-containing protein [Sulfitobacter geojensis]MBM1706495.1 AzlD domain-containing protein [Sulfitobacter geojensis]MBM1710553.1 AzlD domain-containing protein [Sulfitobacter geojensis]